MRRDQPLLGMVVMQPCNDMTVTEERLKQRGYHSFKDYYHPV